jgi:hypothetical protein
MCSVSPPSSHKKVAWCHLLTWERVQFVSCCAPYLPDIIHMLQFGDEMSPKGPCVDNFVPSSWHHWEVVEPLREVGPSGREVRPLGCALEVDVGILAPSLSLSLLPGYHEMSTFVLGHAAAMMCFLTKDPKAWSNGSTDHELKPLNCKLNKPFILVNWLPQICCYSNRKHNVLKRYMLNECLLIVFFPLSTLDIYLFISVPEIEPRALHTC